MEFDRIDNHISSLSDSSRKMVPKPTFSTGEMKFDLEQLKQLRKAYEQRWRNLVVRSEKLGISLPYKEELWKRIMDCWNRGFKCEYCGGRMKIRGTGSSLKTFSIEHILALHNGGDNSINNLFIVCNDCNIKKGTLAASIFHEISDRGKRIIPSLSARLTDFFRINSDGWTSEYLCISILLRHLGRRSKSSATRRNYLQHLRSFCLWAMMTPDELVVIPKKRVEELVQQFGDTYNTSDYSRRTANNVVTVLRTFFEVNGYKGYNKLDVEGYYTPKRYKKRPEYVPRKHEVYKMADAASSLRNRAIIFSMYSSGVRNSTLRAIKYRDIKDEILRGISILKISVYPEMKEIVPDACKYNLPYYTFICEEATEALRLYLHERIDKYGPMRDSDPLFASEYNQVDRNLRSANVLTARQIQKIAKKSAKAGGIERWNDVKPQCLRKSFESVLRSKADDGNRLDPKVQEFLMGHTLPGCQDNYFDSTLVEEIRLDYSKLKFGRTVVGNKFKRVRQAVAEAFDGTGEDVEKLIEEYTARKHKMERFLNGHS